MNGQGQGAFAGYYLTQQQMAQLYPSRMPADPVTAIRERVQLLRAELAGVEAKRSELDRLERMLAIAEEHLANGVKP